MTRFFAAALALTLILSACAESARVGTGEQGTVRGTVLIGPRCPVENVETPCPDQPVAGVEVQAIRDGTVSATAVTDRRGGFEFELSAGSYVVQAVPEPGGPGMFSKPTRVTVRRGDVVDVTVLLDTGIRAPGG
jgi:hypothetical protein